MCYLKIQYYLIVVYGKDLCDGRYFALEQSLAGKYATIDIGQQKGNAVGRLRERTGKGIQTTFSG